MITLPKSVRAYFSDKAVQAAVEMLVGRRRSPIPEDIKWADLPSYYRALLAARQTQFDHALLLCELWDAAWQGIPRTWTHRPLASPDFDPPKIWDNGWVTRSFRISDDTCHLRVWLGQTEGIQVGLELIRGGKPLLKKKDLPPGWELGDHGTWSPGEEIPVMKPIDPAKLNAFARQALKLCLERTKG